MPFVASLVRLSGGLLVAALCCGADSPILVRVALIIGNGSYEHATPLPNALTDAAALSDRLKKLGFEVDPAASDLTRDGLDLAISRFEDKLRVAGPNVVGFFYYAGHAAQDPLGVNYLLPVDAQLGTAAEVEASGIPLPPLLQAMEDANNAVNIIVLDACRDWFSTGEEVTYRRGLSDMGLHGSVLIAYATRPNDTADEGANLTSSPFSHRLIEALDRDPTIPVALLFDDVQANVYADTDTFQLPMNVNGLVRAGRWAFSDNALMNVADTPIAPHTPVAALSEDLSKLADYREALVKLTRGKTSYVDALLNRLDVLQKYHIDTKQRLAFFLAALGYESGGFQQQTEKFGYSAEMLRRIFPSVVKSDEQAKQIVGMGPEAIANVIYANRLGNGPPSSGDGWLYRGRGVFFLTGKANYQKYGEKIGADLVSAPDLASDLETSIVLAAAIWDDKKANIGADADDMAAAAKRFMGHANNLSARNIWLRKAKAALGI